VCAASREAAEDQRGHGAGALSLRRNRARGPEAKRIACGPLGSLPGQDLPRLSGLLQPRRDVHGVAGNEEITGAAVARRHDLAGVDADPHRQPVAQLAVVPHSVAKLERRRDRSFGVVAVRERQSEHRHDRVADELLDGPAM